ncbi:MAG TPA: hypothetical protein VHZ50_07605 [Puia sp.]|jgi:hypothetical protein|nr:hypothetical protein [Puia sp.]
MKSKQTFIVLFAVLFHAQLFSQYHEPQILTFGQRLINPIRIEVQKSDRGLSFYATNKSLFPYLVQLKFDNLQNLTPIINDAKRVIYSGSFNMTEFHFLDKLSTHYYSYSFTYQIGDPSKKPDSNFIYQLPLAEGKKIKLVSGERDGKKYFFTNVFEIMQDDTIFAMRKGFVTSIPKSDFNFDKIMNANSIEVFHDDGTVAIYQIPLSTIVLVQPAQKIYPLQPIAIVKANSIVAIHIVQLNDNGKLRQLKVKFDTTAGLSENLDDSIVKHTPEIIETELTKSEKKKLAKGTLYK